MRHDYKIKVHCSPLNVVRIKLPSDTRVGKSPDAFQGRSHQLVFFGVEKKATRSLQSQICQVQTPLGDRGATVLCETSVAIAPCILHLTVVF